MATDRPPWSWPGAVALVIGASLGLGWAAGLIIAAVHQSPTSEAGLNLLGSLGQTMAGAVAAYLGYQVGTTKAANSNGSNRAPEADRPHTDGGA